MLLQRGAGRALHRASTRIFYFSSLPSLCQSLGSEDLGLKNAKELNNETLAEGTIN